MVLGAFTASHFNYMTTGLRGLLFTANAIRTLSGDAIMGGVTKGIRYISGNTIPLWTPSLPTPAPRKVNQTLSSDLKVVYFPSCLNQMMGSSKGDPDSTSLMQKTVNLLNKAGYEVIFPEMINHLCCGTIWESKGMPDIADQKSEQLEIALMKASNDGEYPVLCDQSPCLYRMRKTLKGMQLYEPVEFIEKFLIEKLDFLPSDEPVTVFAT